MSLTAGSRLGAYEITDRIGEGGMGQVYRARDTRLGREVAIKILPDLFAQDPERLERFGREARTLASLNHPNIAVIHGLEEGSGPRALVMELVDGEDLSSRIARGALPLDEAGAIARQIADALEAAHDAGITHRDLKPANVKVREDGTVKLLDFGLAKAMTQDTGSSTQYAMNSSTLTVRATQLGMIVGTAAYMLAGRLWLGAPDVRDEPLRRLTVLGPEGQTFFRDSANQAISPDGRRLGFITGSTRGNARLWIRALDSLTAREVEGSPGAQLPSWSPDSRFVGFFAGGKLLTMDAAGGTPQVVADAPDGRGGTWSADGLIVFAASNGGALSRVSANGGTVTAATMLRADQGETGHRFPLFLPDGRHFLFAALPASSGQFNIWVGELDSDERQLLFAAESSPVYAPANGSAAAEAGFWSIPAKESSSPARSMHGALRCKTRPFRSAIPG